MSDLKNNDGIAASLKGVSFSYDGKSQALHNVTLDIEAGSYVSILGANGSGKSTLARLLNALLLPTEGSVEVFGKDTSDSGRLFDIRAEVGMVFQNPEDQIIASLVENDIAFGPENLGLEPAEISQRVKEAIEAVGLAGFERRDTAALSGGQKQRVAVAGVLAMRPRMIIFDEAASMLDPRGCAGLMKHIRALNRRGYTIVSITHFIDDAIQSDRIVVLGKGEIIGDGSPKEVLSNSRMLQEASLHAPFAVRMSKGLQSFGVDIDICIDECELIAVLDSKMRSRNARQEDLDGLGGSKEAGKTCPERSERPDRREQHPEGSGDAQPEDMQPGSKRSDDMRSGDAPSGKPDDTCPSQANPSELEFKDAYFTYNSSRRQQRSHLEKSHGREAASASSQGGWGDKADKFWVLDDIDLRIQKGDYIGLAGHTGAGKSTLIQLANALIKPTFGDVEVCGNTLKKRDSIAFARSKVGIVFQYPERQLFAKTVREDVAFGPGNLGLDAALVQSRVDEALRGVGLDPERFGDRNPFELSGGQKRRCAIAGIIAMDPSILILDEPCAGLDGASHDAVLDMIDGLRAKYDLTVVIISHDMDDIAKRCSRVVVMEKGRIVSDGKPVDVLSDGNGLRNIGLEMPDVLRLAKAVDVWPVDAIPSEDGLARIIAERIATAQKAS